MRELELLSRIYARSSDLSAAYPHVLVGPGDDCAVVEASGPLLLKVDQLVEGRHFVRGTSLELIARKAVARAVSDIAAMAGTPMAALAACALPHGFPQEPANQLFDAVSRWARHFGCPLVGGDIASFAEAGGPLMLTITVVGRAHEKRGAVLRSGARDGDVLYMTGSLGGSFDKATGGGRHLTFEPRLREASWLADELGADLHAMMDISDGLGVDAGRMAEASGVGLELEAAALPLSSQMVVDTGAAVLDAVSAGEDYELLFAVVPGRNVPRRCPLTGTEITRVGTCRAGGAGSVLRMADGSVVDITQRGWEHR